MTIVPTLAPPEAQPSTMPFDMPVAQHLDSAAHESAESRPRPFRLGIVGFGVALALFSRLVVANGYGDLTGRGLTYAAAVSSAIAGLGLLGMAAERDRFGAPLMWISAIVALSWGTMNWISPPFDSVVTVWSNQHQTALATLGVGNGLLLAGIIALAFVRRPPNLTATLSLAAAVVLLASNTLLLRNEWPAVGLSALAFGLVLLAWDRSPRREPRFATPDEAPRISRAALSLAAFALCGTTLQLWLSRMSAPRSRPAIAAAVVLLAGAFLTLIGVRREIQRRETTLSEWRSWIREIRRNNFRAELENFQSPVAAEPAEEPRPLSFPDLLPLVMEEAPTFATEAPAEVPALEVAEPILAPAPMPVPPMPAPEPVPPMPAPEPELTPAIALPRIVPTAEAPAVVVEPPPLLDTPLPSAVTPFDEARGAFSALATNAVRPAKAGAAQPLAGGIDELAAWCARASGAPWLVAVEAMTLDRFDQLSQADQRTLRHAVEGLLLEAMPAAELVAWIDGPYYIVVHAEFSNTQIMALNKTLLERLQGTVDLGGQRPTLRGTLAFLRPTPPVTLDNVVDEAVTGLIRARRLERATLGVRP